MVKRILSLVFAFVLCVGLLPTTAYAKESKAYKKYQEAMLATTASGSWSETLSMTANMAISNGSTKMKTKATIASEMNISDYDKSNLSDIKMSGSANISVMNQSYAWDMEYENGVAHYTYTEPNQTSTDLEMDPSYFNFDIMTEDMMTKAKVSGNKITFTIPGDKMEEAGIAAVNMMPGINDLSYGDVDVEVIINKSTGVIDQIMMTFHASLEYQGYDAEVDYQIDYIFSSQAGSDIASKNDISSGDSDISSNIDARADWIEQHMEYAVSNEYKQEIVRGFNGSLNDLFIEIKKDDVIKSYSTLDSINQILSFDLDLSETQEYELLLGQIFFTYVGEDAIEEIYAENLTKAVIMLGELMLGSDDFKQIGDSDQLKGILDTLKSSKGVEKMNEACDSFFNFVDGYDNINIKKHLADNIKKESFNLVWDIAIDSLDLVTTTLKELTMYVAVGEAYSQTSGAFGEVLLGMRRKINVDSDNPVFEPIMTQDLVTNEVIWKLTTSGDSPFPDPLNTPVVLKDLATAIENFYTSIETYKNEDATYIAENAIADLKDGTVNDVLINNCENAAVSLFSCLPIVREYKIIKDILSTGQSLIDLMTSIDDQEYLGTMLIRLYCISYLQYLSVNNLAGTPQSWESIPLGYNSTPGTILITNQNQDLDEYQFNRATSFDEAVNVYKSISVVAADYALKYTNIFLGEAMDELYTYDNGGFFEQFLKNRDKLVQAINDYKNTVVMLENQRSEIQKITCHDSDLQYDSVNDEIGYDFKDSKIYIVACPVDVIVKNETGEQIAYLAGEDNEVMEGYEFYFHTIKIPDDSGEYIKVAIVPDNYQIEMKGTDKGVMNAFVADFIAGDVGEIETYFNIPVRKNAKGYFKVNTDGSGDSSLIMSRKSYSNMTTIENVPVPSQQNGYLVYIITAGVAAGLLLVLLLFKSKHHKK